MGNWRTTSFAALAIFAGIYQAQALDWTGTSAPTSVSWLSIAASADGTKMVAAASYPTWSVYTSADSGATWMETTQNVGFVSVVSSADGTKLAGAQNYDGFIFTSTDSGLTWAQTSAPRRTWLFMTSSTNGTKLAAVGQNGQPGPIQIYASVDSGKTWSLTSAPATNWNALAASADGTKLVAATGGNGSFYTSTDSGTNWTQQTNAPNIWWAGVASSADGTKLAAIATANAGIYTSTNAGINWTPRTNAPNANWYCIAASADGTTLVAAIKSGFGAGAPGPIYTSTNSGVTWTSNSVPVEWWSAVTCSADGTKLAAASGYVTNTPSGGLAVDQIITSTPHLAMSMAVQDVNDVTVIWPWPADNYYLQQNSGVASTNWVYVTNAPVITNYLSRVTLPLVARKSFFRLTNTKGP
jgi:photosystem II stability/assembly factor-like uncharacterized protein